jgi:hypothetical protein
MGRPLLTYHFADNITLDGFGEYFKLITPPSHVEDRESFTALVARIADDPEELARIVEFQREVFSTYISFEGRAAQRIARRILED